MEAPKKRGRPKKEENLEIEDVKVLETEPLQIEDIKHVFRTISVDGQFHSEGAIPASSIEDYLKQSYFGQGYKLYGIFHVRVVPQAEGGLLGHEMLYVLVK